MRTMSTFSLLSIGLLSVTLFGCRKTEDVQPPADKGEPGSECAAEACGPAPGMPQTDCGDGSFSGPSGRCLRNSEGACGWEIRECADKGSGAAEAG